MTRYLITVLAIAPLCSCGGSEKKAEGPVDDRVSIGDRDPDSRDPLETDGDDDDGDDDLQISGLRGHLDPYDIERGVQPHAGALTGCYNGKVGRMRYVGGDVELKYLISKAGEVKRVQLAKSDLGAWNIEKCLLETARQMSFAKPKGGEAVFSLPLEFSPTRSVQWVDEDTGLAQIKPFVDELSACAGEAESRNPRQVTVTAYVGPRGVVKSVGFASDAKREIPDAWADCAEIKVKAWTLADPLGRIAKLAFRYN